MTEDFEARLCADIHRACEAFPPPGQRGGAIFLTPAEIRVFRLIGLGLSNAELAARLSIDLTTVRTHLKRVHDKCAIEGRSRLALVSCHIWHLKPESRKELSAPPKG